MCISSTQTAVMFPSMLTGRMFISLDLLHTSAHAGRPHITYWTKRKKCHPRSYTLYVKPAVQGKMEVLFPFRQTGMYSKRLIGHRIKTEECSWTGDVKRLVQKAKEHTSAIVQWSKTNLCRKQNTTV